MSDRQLHWLEAAGSLAPWREVPTALDAPALAEWTVRAKAEAEALRYDHSAWVHGSSTPFRQDHAGPPRWAGYAIGFDLVGRYLRGHPEARPSQLCDMHAARLLKDVWP